MNLRIIIVVVVKSPFFLAVLACVLGEWDLIPWATFPGWEAMELNNFPRLWTQVKLWKPLKPQTSVPYLLTAPVQVILRESLSLRVSLHRLLFVLRIKELWLNYKGCPEPYFSGLKNGRVTFCWHCRECGLCWWIRDRPLKFQPEVLVLQHQLYFFEVITVTLVPSPHQVPCSVVFIWCDLLSTKKQARATFISKWREKNDFLWNEMTMSCLLPQAVPFIFFYLESGDLSEFLEWFLSE